jgi:hypothetical protein
VKVEFGDAGADEQVMSIDVMPFATTTPTRSPTDDRGSGSRRTRTSAT